MKAERMKELQDKNSSLSLVSCYMHNPELLDKYPLTPKDFIYDFHRYVYKALVALKEQGYKKITPTDIERFLEETNSHELKVYKEHQGSLYTDTAFKQKVSENVEAYYSDMMKWSILRNLEDNGINISAHYEGETSLDVDSEANLRRENSSVKEIIEYYEEKNKKALSGIKARAKACLGITGSLTPKRASELEGANEPIEYLIEDWMEKDSFNSIIGAAKAGKTQYTMQMAFCVQNGIPFLGHECKKADVLYVDFELKPNAINRRINLLKQFYEMPDAEDYYCISASQDFANGTIDMNGILELVREAKKNNPNIKLCIFDCFYTFAKGDGNCEDDVKKILQPLKGLVDDMSVCYVHHTNKTSSDMTNLIYAAGGSGVHGKIVDSTYVIWQKSEKDSTFNVATTGRSGGGKKLVCIKNENTFHQFKLTEDTDDRHKIAGKAVEKNPKETHPDIWAAVGINGADLRKIKKMFNLDTSELREIGFTVESDKHKIYRK